MRRFNGVIIEQDTAPRDTYTLWAHNNELHYFGSNGWIPFGDIIHKDLQSQIDALTARVVTLESQVKTLQSKVSTLEGQVSALQSDVSTLKSQMSTANSNISSLQSNYSSLARRVSDLESY